MASKTFNYPELCSVVDRAFAQALRDEQSPPSNIAYAIWCWIHGSPDLAVTDHSPVSATTTTVPIGELVKNDDATDAALGDLTARVDNLETDLENLKFKLSNV